MDNYHKVLAKNTAGKIGAGSKIRDMLSAQGNTHIVASALMLAMSITAVLDTPSRLYIFEDRHVVDDNSGDYDRNGLNWASKIYALMVFTATILFSASLAFGLLNNMLVNMIDDADVFQFLKVNHVVLRMPVLGVFTSFFFWIASLTMFAYYAFGRDVFIVLNVINGAILFVWYYLYVRVLQRMDVPPASLERRRRSTQDNVETTGRRLGSAVEIPPGKFSGA